MNASEQNVGTRPAVAGHGGVARPISGGAPSGGPRSHSPGTPHAQSRAGGSPRRSGGRGGARPGRGTTARSDRRSSARSRMSRRPIRRTAAAAVDRSGSSSVSMSLTWAKPIIRRIILVPAKPTASCHTIAQPRLAEAVVEERVRALGPQPRELHAERVPATRGRSPRGAPGRHPAARAWSRGPRRSPRSPTGRRGRSATGP